MTSLQQIYTEAQAQWRELQESELPVFFVGAATCGRAAGATEVLQQLRSCIWALGEIAVEHGLDPEVEQTLLRCAKHEKTIIRMEAYMEYLIMPIVLTLTKKKD